MKNLQKIRKIKTKRGSALALAMVMVVIVSIILTSLLGYISSQISYSKDRIERERAFQISEAGIYYYRWYLAHKISGNKTQKELEDFWNSNPIGVGSPYTDEFKDPEGNVVGSYMLEIEKPEVGSTIVIAKSTGWTSKKPSAKRTVQVRFRKPSWSENVVLADDNMRFGTGTTVNGKIHSNEGIRFDGIATNVVSSSLPSYDDPDHNETGADKLEFGVHTHKATNGSINDNYRPNEVPPHAVDSRTDVFQAGRQFPVAGVSFTGVISDIKDMRTQAVSNSAKFDNTGQGRRIILKTNGTFDICTVNSYSFNDYGNNYNDEKTNAITNYIGVISEATGSYAANNGSPCVTNTCCTGSACPYMYSNHNRGKCYSLTNQAIPDNGVIFVADNIWLEGTIDDRRVSIVAAELSDEPIDSQDNNNGAKNVYLGMDNLLYSNTDGSDILGIIAQNDVEVIRNSLTNLTIDAALLAKDGKVGRNYYDGITKNSITINGSIATSERYGFAYTDGTGYITRNLNFDNNLLYYPPPYFPTGKEYSIDQWDEL